MLGVIASAFVRKPPDALGKLRDALVEVQKLQETLETIERDISAKTDITRFEQYVSECSNRFEQERTFANERELVLAVIIRDHASERVRPILFARKYSDGSEPYIELFKRHRDWRDTLKTACAAKLALAEAEYEKVCATVREQLGGDFDSLDLENEPRIKKARREVSMWRGVLTQCASEKDAPALWGRVTRNLQG